MTFNLPLSKINAAQLEALKAVVREGRQLDYKETLPGNSDDDKREFLSDVTSFANAAGGDIIYGVRDKREAGKPTGEIDAITGLPGLNFDADSLRLDEMVRNGIAPRLPVNFHEIRRDPEAHVCCCVYPEVRPDFTWSPTRISAAFTPEPLRGSTN